MTPHIDDFIFTGWSGRLHAAKRRIARLPPRPGINGEAWVYDGWQTNPEPIVTTMTYSTRLEADAALAGYRALMDGTMYYAFDPLGSIWNVRVVSVEGEVSQTVLGKFLLRATWTLQVEAAP